MKATTIAALLLPCALLLGAPSSVFAQEAESTLDEITVTATRIEEKKSDVPASVSIITAADIEARGVKTVAEAIETAAGVVVADYGSAGSQKTATIRGSTSSEVLVLVDGVRVSSAMSGYTDISNLPADAVERIEVLRGGASALYGSDAVGGVVNIIMKKRQAPFVVSIENGSFLPDSHVKGYGASKTANGPNWPSLVDSQKISFSAAPLIGDVLLRASGGFTRAANEFTFIDSSDEMRIRQNAGLLAGNAAAGIGVPVFGGELDIDFSGSWKQIGVPGSLSTPTLNASQTDARAAGVVKLTAGTFFTDALDFTATAHAEWADVGYANADAPSEDSDSQLFTAGLELQQTARASESISFVYGVSGAYDRGSSTEFGAPQRLSAGAFIAPELAWGDFSLRPTLRYDYYSDYAPGAFSGSIGGVWKLSGKDSLKANISASYRAPSFEDLYWPSGAGVEGNPDLSPETGYCADVGYERSADGLSYSAFAFARYVRDVILWQVESDGIWRPSNFGAALYPGIEQELKIGFLDGFSASVSYTFLYSFTLDEGMSFADDKRVPYTPVHTLNATLGYAANGFSWSVTGRFQSLRYLKIANSDYLPAFLVVDAIVKKALWKGWEGSIAVDNLFGEQYQAVSGYPMPTTSVRIGLTATL